MMKITVSEGADVVTVRCIVPSSNNERKSELIFAKFEGSICLHCQKKTPAKYMEVTGADNDILCYEDNIYNFGPIHIKDWMVRYGLYESNT